MNLGRLIRTVRYLRFRQVIGQIRHRIPVPALPAPPGRPMPGLGSGLPAGVLVLPPAPGLPPLESLKQGEFIFLNRLRELGWPPRWDPPDCPKLWLYNLHYFHWLDPLDYPDCRSAVSDWIRRYRPSGRAAGWEPYPVSLRLINWLRIFRGKYSGQLGEDAVFRKVLEESVSLQARWLDRRLETRLLGNHYLENAVALAMAGNLLQGPEAECWALRGRRILEREIPEQILPDGLQFELSPMYHLRAVWVVLLLAAGGAGEKARPDFALLDRMLEALDRLTHPDGEIALFGDSALDIYPRPAELRRAAERITGRSFVAPGEVFGGWELPAAGYFGFRDREGNCLICDAGRIGPDYLPGHGHGDIFSFELSLRGKRVVVDSGVSGYEPGPERDYDRSTRAHNTVEIEGADQAEFWGAFRVGRRGRPRDVRCRVSADGFSLEGRHDGYRRLRGSPVHHRSFQFSGEGVLEVADRIESCRPVAAVSRVHLHPDCRIEGTGDREVRVAYPGGSCRIVFRGPGVLKTEKSSYSPRFGVRQDNIALAFSGLGDNIRYGFKIVAGEENRLR